MKKHSLLMLLPFALIVTGCSGSLKKGNIFNEKFMKANFADKVEKAYEFTAPRKVELNIGEHSGMYPSDVRKDLIWVPRADSKGGYFSVLENKYVLPIDLYATGSNVYTASGFSVAFVYNYKNVDGEKVSYLYDEYGNKIFEGKGWGIGLAKTDLEYVPGSDLKTLITVTITENSIKIPVAYAYYTVDAKLKEVLTPEEYFAKKDHMLDASTSLREWGHPELISSVQVPDGSYHYKVYNTEKEKFVSSFSMPVANSVRVGNYIYYQIEKTLHDREDNYDFYDGASKINYETYRINYLTGKVSKFKTDIVFSATEDISTFKDDKGVKNYVYLNQTKGIEKDKTLSKTGRNVILDKNFKEVADVSGIDFGSIKKFGENYWTVDKTVYDSKMKEVGYLDNFDKNHDAKAPRIAKTVNGFGLVDFSGKYIVNPTWTTITKLEAGEYYAASNSKVIKVFKVADEKATEISSLDLERYTMAGLTGSEAHYIVTDTQESKDVVWDAQTGAITELPDTTGSIWSQDITTYNNSVVPPQMKFIREGSLKANVVIHSDGSNYFAIESRTSITLSYASEK